MFQGVQQPIGPVEGLRVRGQTGPVCPQITSPDRGIRLPVDQACQQQSKEHGVGDFLVTTLFLIAKVAFGPESKGANIAPTSSTVMETIWLDIVSLLIVWVRRNLRRLKP